MRTPPPALRQAAPLLLAIGAGALLGLPRAFPVLAPLQIPGFAAFFLLAHGCVKLREAVKLGALAGLCSAITALIFVHVHLAAAVLLLVSLTFNHALFGTILLLFLRHGKLGAFVAGAGVITLGEWGFAHLLPIFGTAQYTTCAWSAWPGLVRHEAFLGACGTLLLVALLGACTAGLWLRAGRALAALGLAATLLLGAGLGFARAAVVTPASTNLRVAAAADDAQLLLPEARHTYAPWIAEAARQGAKLVVLPEMAVFDDGTAGTVQVFGALAREHRIAVVVGLHDFGVHLKEGHSVNCALAIDAEGRLQATHTKAHHIPFMEQYTQKGDAGWATLAHTGAGHAGLLICQDDNFTDLASSAAAHGAQLLLVPTLDWQGIETAHFANSRHRPLETGLPLVRAAHGGISAIFDANGAVLARRNHLKEGPGVIVADVPLSAQATPFTRFGDLPVLALAALAVGLGMFSMRGKKTAAAAVA